MTKIAALVRSLTVSESAFQIVAIAATGSCVAYLELTLLAEFFAKVKVRFAPLGVLAACIMSTRAGLSKRTTCAASHLEDMLYMQDSAFGPMGELDTHTRYQ